MKVLDFIQEAKNGSINVVENAKEVLEEAQKIDKEYHYLASLAPSLAEQTAEKANKKGLLYGLPISVKDCICVKGVPSAAGSFMLKEYVPPFNATVINKVIAQGGVVLGKTVQDEFGFGSFNINNGETFPVPLNPFDKERSCGGSSGGSGGLTSLMKHEHIALAESTGGSIAAPAAFCGVVGFTPTYGVVSRYGLIDYGSSLDKIGVMGKEAEACKLVFNVIRGADNKDSTCLNVPLGEKKIKKVAIIKEAFTHDKVSETVLNRIQELGYEYDEISLDFISKYSIPTYFIIAMSEASTNLAKYCGMRYGYEEKAEGHFNEYFSSIRGRAFNKETKRRIILGTFARMSGFREAYYMKALRLRRLITEHYKIAFKKYDALITPTMPILPPKFSEIQNLNPIDLYKMDVLTVGPNVAGLPHITFNAGFVNNLPVGMMAIGDHFTDLSLFGFEEQK